VTDGLRQMAFACAARTEKERIFPSRDESARGEIEYQTAVHLRIESEIEVVERLVGVAKAGLLSAAVQQAIRAPGEFIRDQTRNQINGRHDFGLRLLQACFEYARHAT
jgi:hypothetical protein